MRPVRLVIEGVNSFTDAQTLDFEAVGRNNLFCICGKTGAGKTTIFDSIMLALFGRSGKGNLADVVNLSRDRAAVTLEFEAAGERYGVERIIKCRAEADGEQTGKRTATSECTLYKNGAPVAKGEDAADEIERIIGLGFSEFKNVYLLEQGEYAEFLKKQSAKQIEAVGRIFSLMRFGDVYKRAAEKKRATDEEVRHIEARISDLGDVSDNLRRTLKSELASVKATLRDRDAAYEKLGVELAELDAQHDAYIAAQEKQKTVQGYAAKLETARENKKSATSELMAFAAEDKRDEYARDIASLREEETKLAGLNMLDREEKTASADVAAKRKEFDRCIANEAGAANALARLKAVRDDERQTLDGLLSRFYAAADALSEKSDALSATVAALKAGGKAIDAYYGLCGEKSAYDELEDKRKKAEDTAQHEDSLAAAELKKIELYVAERADCAAAVDELKAKEQAATDALSAAQLASHAAAVRAELKAGDTCPVCGGVYNGGGCEGSDVAAAKAALDAAVIARQKKEKELADRDRHIDRAKSDHDNHAAARDAARREADGVAAAIKRTCVDPAAYAGMIKLLDSARAQADRVSAAESELSHGEPKHAAAAAELTAAEQAYNDAAAKADALRAKLGDMLGRTDGMLADVKAKLKAVEGNKATQDAKYNSLVAARDRAANDEATFAKLYADARADCPADIKEFDEAAYNEKKAARDGIYKECAALVAEQTRKETELKTLEEKLDKKKKLEAERKDSEARADRYGVIADMTKGKAMLNYVATEYIEDFTAVASDILGRLSGGKYSMSYDRELGFAVADYLNGGKSRKTDTLSGGEMFLASLSVAIAIARAVGRDAESGFFFLDEGFGTLDDELIDTVFGALEELARTCLVGVISHSSALIELMPASVEVVEANDVAGSRIR